MTTSQWWDSVAIRVDSALADGGDFTINFLTPDTDQSYVIEMSSGTLTNIEGFLSPEPDATIRINRSELNAVIMGEATLGDLLQTGRGTVEGDGSVLTRLAGVLVNFAPGFEIMPGTQQLQ
jgi:alkyl sulfatase BDS1-like metallo-beta-lactamase superfamily hydrolase